MSGALLDVNALVALFDPGPFIMRVRTGGWRRTDGIRVLSHPGYPMVRAMPADVISHPRIF
jgi:hypothetical protein